MRGLARERLPARHLREVHEPLAALPQLLGHAVERVDRAAHFVAWRRAGSRPVSSRRDQSPAAKSVRPAVSCSNRLADAVRDEDQRRQRDEPRRAEQQEQRQREPAPQVAPLDRLHELRASAAARSRAAPCGCRAGRGCTSRRRACVAAGVASAHVVHVIAAGARQAEPLGLAALPERAHRLGPVGRIGDAYVVGVARPASASCFSASRSR